MISHNLLQTLQKPFPTQGNTVLICLKGTHDYFSYRDFSSFATYILFGYYHWGNLFSLQSKIPMNENKETFENKSDLSSNKHYLSSSENEAWKKFRIRTHNLCNTTATLPTESEPIGSWSLCWSQVNLGSDK